MHSQIAALASNISKLQKFAIDYPMDYPSAFYCAVTVEGEEPQISFVANDRNREEVLGILGQTFGTQRWQAEPQPYNQSYNWIKTIDNIKLIICSAELLPPLAPKPVNPKSFPLLLK